MNAQDPNQFYHDGQAEGYTAGFTDCDANVYGWARAQLIPERVKGKTVVDFGCGNGAQTFAHLRENGASLIIGVEASEDMLNLVAQYRNQIRRTVTDVPTHFLELISRFAERDHFQVLINGKIQEVSQRIRSMGDVGVNLFNVLCFDDPAEPIRDMREALKPGAPLVIVSNAFVDSHIPLNPHTPFVSTSVNIHGSDEETGLEPGTVFRQVLHLVGDNGEPAPIALQDHIHTLAEYSRALPEDQWTIRTAEVFPPQGCTLIDPRGDSPYREMFDLPEFQNTQHPIHSGLENSRLQYAKLCLIAERT